MFPFVYNNRFNLLSNIATKPCFTLQAGHEIFGKFLICYAPCSEAFGRVRLGCRLLGRLIQEPFVCFGQISDFISISMNANRLRSTVRGVLEKFLLFYLTDRILYQFKIGAK